jgi:hypothetical protein
MASPFASAAMAAAAAALPPLALLGLPPPCCCGYSAGPRRRAPPVVLCSPHRPGRLRQAGKKKEKGSRVCVACRGFDGMRMRMRSLRFLLPFSPWDRKDGWTVSRELRQGRTDVH